MLRRMECIQLSDQAYRLDEHLMAALVSWSTWYFRRRYAVMKSLNEELI
jgi:hypothetical protein